MKKYRIQFAFIGAQITVEISAHNEEYANIVLRQMMSEYVNDMLEKEKVCEKSLEV